MAGSRKKPQRVPVPPQSKRNEQGRTPLLTRRRLVVVGIAAALVAAVLVGASLLTASGDGDDGGGGGGNGGSTLVAGGADVETLLQGIPQSETVLGEEDAPLTLVEYADLQCPFCAQWARGAFPELVEEYVRDGRLKIEFRGLAFIGPDSEEALRAALSAGEQGKLWNVVDLVFVNQGAENSGWVTDDFLHAVGEAVPGLDADRMMEARDSAEVTATIEEAAAAAQDDMISGTPSFLLGETGGELEPLQISSLGPEEFRAAIDELLGE